MYLPGTGTGTGCCDGFSIALHADDVHKVSLTCVRYYELQSANVSNVICVVVSAHCGA